MGLLDGFKSLGRDINKVKDSAGAEAGDGADSTQLGELTLEMPDAELIGLKKKWESGWEKASGDLLKKQEDAERYWLGNQYAEYKPGKDSHALVDNRIFSSLETFLPIATRQNPEALVLAGDQDESGTAAMLARKVKKMLAYETDRQRLRLKLKKLTRFWALYYLGPMKIGWDVENDEMITRPVRPQKLTLDPDAIITEEGEYTGEFVGETRRDTASILIRRFKAKETEIREAVNHQLGTGVKYKEWWTDQYVFWSLESEVLGKNKNPHWNYGRQETQMDEFGAETLAEVPGVNHFTRPKKPYVFLSVFGLDRHPFDETSLLEQNIALQDLVNKRMAQVDKNVDGMNGGWAVSGGRAGMTKAEAQKAIESARKGGGMFINDGNVNEALARMTVPGLPPDVYQSLQDARAEIDNVFGTHSTTRGEDRAGETATGHILLKGQDEGRISLPADFLEQVCDQIFNWWTQMMYVYFDRPHVAAILGRDETEEYETLRKEDLGQRLLVSVKEGSMLPKDDLSRRNEAVELFKAGALDPISLFERLDFPNPRESAKQLYLWTANPTALFPDLAPPAPVAPPGEAPPVEAPPPAPPVEAPIT